VAKRRVFISFDFHHDRNYRYLLSAFNENPANDIEFIDSTPGEIDTMEVGRVKAVLTTKIRGATHTLVLVGKYANTPHKDRAKIGTLNWQWWEIEKSKEEGKTLISAKIERSNETPEPLLNAGATWASYTVESILKALREA
jgi:hypothetical protein